MLSRRRPILVTGLPRSGTTWIGRMLATSRQTQYVFEPFTASRHKTLSLRPHTLQGMFPYVPAGTHNAQVFEFVASNLGLSRDYRAELGAIASMRDVPRFLLRELRYQSGRWRQLRPIQKDPHAILSAPWLAETFQMDVVITLRHPAATVASLLRKTWRYQLRSLLRHAHLTSGPLRPFAEQLDAFRPRDDNQLDEAILLWNCLMAVLLDYRRQFPGWTFVRHEDLARDPVPGFEQLYAAVGLNYTAEVREQIAANSTAGNPTSSAHGQVKRDSLAASEAWRSSLPAATIERIRHETARLADQLYAEPDW